MSQMKKKKGGVKMAKINKGPEDRKEEVKEAKKDEKVNSKFGVELKPKFQGGVEKPAIKK